MPGSGKTHLTVKLLETLLKLKKQEQHKRDTTLVIVPSLNHVRDIVARGGSNLQHPNGKPVVFHADPSSSSSPSGAKGDVLDRLFIDKLIVKNSVKEGPPREEMAAKEEEIADRRRRLELEKVRGAAKGADDSLTQQHDAQANLIKEIHELKKELKMLGLKKVRIDHTPTDVDKHNITVARCGG